MASDTDGALLSLITLLARAAEESGADEMVDDLELPGPKCTCGERLVGGRVDKLHRPGVAVMCDGCRDKSSSRDIMWHCPKGQIREHTGGYDLCCKCGFKAMTGATDTPKCTCGVLCKELQVKDVYSAASTVRCDKCRRKVGRDSRLWHCPRDAAPPHTGSYDVCCQCAILELVGVACPCGAPMALMKVSDMYPSGGIRCDDCRESVPGPKAGLHCPRGRTAAHTGGYDYCMSCAVKKATAKAAAAGEAYTVPASMTAVEGPATMALLSALGLLDGDRSGSPSPSATSASSAPSGDSSTKIIREGLKALGMYDEYWSRFESQGIEDSILEDLTPDAISELFSGKIGPRTRFSKWLDAYLRHKGLETLESRRSRASVTSAAAASASSASSSRSSMAGSKKCSLLCGRDATRSCIPCGHYCICDTCAPRVKSVGMCPMCHGDVTDTFKVLL